MSFEAVLWATTDAPIANVNEFAVLMMLAEKADPDGCNAFPSRPTVAARTTVDPKTVLRALQSMEARGLIGEGDQRAAEYIRADRRPTVYDLLIPYSWFPNIDRINREREQRGRPPLTGSTRPDIAPAPEKRTRSDKGKPRSKKRAADQDESSRGDYKSPRDSDGYGVTLSPPRGDYKSATGGLQVTQTSPVTQPTNLKTSPRPSVHDVQVPGANGPGGRMDGRGGGDRVQERGPVPARGTEGGGVTGDATPDSTPETSAAAAGGVPAVRPLRVESSPGVSLLINIGREKPEFLLTGQVLQHQGLTVTGLLDAGWRRDMLWEVISGRPLPSPITKSVGAIIAGRLRAAVAMPVPGSDASMTYAVPHQAPAPDRALGERWETAPAPARWDDVQEQQDRVRRGIDRDPGCEGDDGMCDRLAVVGETRCAAHLGWPLCPGHGEYTCPRRTRDGERCATCQEQEQHARFAAALPAPETDDGRCPGHTSPCGRAVVTEGLCPRCRIAAQRDRDRLQREWDAAVAAASAAAEAEEAAETPAASDAYARP